MKTTTGNKTRLGIFVTLSLGIFIVGIYFIGKKQQLFGSTFHISATFKDINGLQIGNNVLLAGINVGIIDEITQVTDSTVKVEMMINENSRKFIKKDVKAIIGSDGLMGNKIVKIIPGQNSKLPVADNDVIETAEAISVDEILTNVKLTSQNSAIITENLAAITESIRDGRGALGKLFMDTVFAENLDAAMVNIKQGAGGFKQNMSAASNNIFLRKFFKKKEKNNQKK